MSNPPSNNVESTFNEAFLKMQRIGLYQSIINELRTNPLAWNVMHGKYNYEVIISNLVSLCNEVSPLMKVSEFETFKQYRKITDEILTYKPIHETYSSSNFEETKTMKEINYKNWEMLKDIMTMFEDFTRKQVDLHGYASPKKKNASRASIDL